MAKRKHFGQLVHMIPLKGQAPLEERIKHISNPPGCLCSRETLITVVDNREPVCALAQ
jgi:hypothetical protein